MLRRSTPAAHALPTCDWSSAVCSYDLAGTERRDGAWRVAARRSWSGTGAWSEPEVLSRSGADAISPVVAIGGPSDRVVVSWIEGNALGGKVMVTTLE